ncbi:MAG TPA: lysophospholipid acyltransferase family protein [Chryseosolibacter sp.]
MANAKRIRRYIQYGIVYWFVRLLIAISMMMSRKSWLKVCGGLGKLAYYVATKTRQLTIRHLSMAFPTKSPEEVKALAKSTFKMLGKNAGDILRSSRSVKSLKDLEKFLITDGLENYEVAHKKGKGVIFLTCHLGAFDMQITNMAMRGLDPNIIGTPLKNKRLNDLLWEYRNAHGAIAIARGKETFKLIKVLKSGGSVALLIDQDTKVKSVFVDFFGMKAATPAGATILALKTGAAVIPTYIHLGEDGLQHMYLLPEIPMTITGDEEKDVVFNTQILTNFIEETIRKYPDQWVWMHERWKTKEV